MTTTIPLLKAWFAQGLDRGNVTHMIIKYDSFDGEDYPVYVTDDQDVREVDSSNVERTMEVYAMHLPFASQAAEFRSNHYEYPEEN